MTSVVVCRDCGLAHGVKLGLGLGSSRQTEL